MPTWAYHVGMTNKERAKQLRQLADQIWERAKIAQSDGKYEKSRSLKTESSELHAQAHELELKGD